MLSKTADRVDQLEKAMDTKTGSKIFHSQCAVNYTDAHYAHLTRAQLPAIIFNLFA